MVSTTRRVLSLLLVLCVFGVPAAFAQAPSVVHPFDGVTAGNPAAGLTLGADGFLYGTSEAPAPFGAVFRVRPDGTDFQVLHTFAQPAGVVPGHGALARGADGVFYGTTRQGGSGGGTVYRLEVGPSGARVTTLHAFAAPDTDPDGGVILASDGLLYGTFGNDLTTAAVYRLATDGTGFAHLRGLPNGYRPTGTLLEGSDGLLYGTTELGGATGGGTVFRLSRSGADYATLVELEGNPVAGLTEAPGPDGTPHLFGVETRGQNPVTELGAIFQLRPDGTAFLRIAGFTASPTDGDTPRAPLLRGRDGALYGTATSERVGCLPENCGTVFRVTPSGRPFSLFTFSPVAGGVPMGALVQGPDGTLYGTARVGGPAAIGPGTGHGTVFAVPDPDRIPLAFTGPAIGDEGAEAAYVLTLRNTTNHTLAGPLTVLVTPTPGLVFADQSVDDWNCTQPQASGLVCVWPTDLAPEVESAPHELRFTLTAPFSTDCGTGPSPCVSVTVLEPDSGGAAHVTTTVRALSGGTLNTPPSPQDDIVPVYGTAPTIVRVLDNDADPDGDPLRVTRLLESPRLGDATINADGTITYTPTGTSVQADTFRYEVSDGRVPTDGRASAVVTLRPSVPTLTSSKARLDLGPLAPRRIATGRFSLRSPAAMEGRIVLEPVTAAEIAAALQGTAHDPALAVSDPGAFRAQPGFSIDPAYPFSGLVMLHYQAPPAVGRVSVARARLIGEPLGLAPVTHTVLIVASSADPATAPPRAVDDTTATPVRTEVWYDVLANDDGVSLEGRRLYVSSVGCMSAFPDTDCFVPPNMSVSQTGPASITGPQEMAFRTASTVTGTATVMYAVSELDACVGAQQSGVCQLEGNMYYGYLSVEVGGTPPDLSLSLAPTASTVAPGETVTLTATVTNHGPGTASRVTVSGFTALTQLGGLVVAPSQGTCAIPAPGSAVTCTLGNLAQGASATITLQGSAPATLIPPGATSVTLDVAAGVSFGNADAQPGNNTAQARIVITAQPVVQLGLAIATTPTAVRVGDDFTYDVVLSNTSVVAASNLSIVVSAPAEVGGLRFDASGVGGWGCQFSPPFASGDATPGQTYTCALGALPAGANLTLRVSARLLAHPAAAQATIAATAGASGCDDLLPSLPGTQCAFAFGGPLAVSASLQATVLPASTPQAPRVRDVTPVRLVLTNAGTVTARQTRLVAQLPAELGFAGAIQGPPRAWGCRYLPAVQSSVPVGAVRLECSAGDLAAGQSVEFVVQAHVLDVPPAGLAAVVLEASSLDCADVSSAPGVQCATANGSIPVSSTTLSSSIAIERIGGPAPIALGDLLRATVRVANTGTVDARDLSMRLVLPLDLGMTSMGPSSVAGWGCRFDPALAPAGTPGAVATCSTRTLPAGQSLALSFDMRALAVPASGRYDVAVDVGSTDCVNVAAPGDMRVCTTATGTAPVIPTFNALVGFDGGDVRLATNAGTFRAARGLPLASVPQAPLPVGVRFPYGAMSFELIDVPVGGTATITLATPAPVSGYWKLVGNSWTRYAGGVATAGGLTLTLVDGGPGDDDGIANGVIVDPGALGVLDGPPSADAGADLVVEATSAAGAPVPLGATGVDPDGGAVTFAWSGACGVGAGSAVTLTCPIGTSIVTVTVTDGDGQSSSDDVQVTVRDTTPPAVVCDAPDAVWRRDNVGVMCRATDQASGVAPADATFTVATNVADGVETAAAMTASRQVCDLAGNCAQAGPVGPFRIDRLAPALVVTAPADGAVFLLHARVAAVFTCDDGGSGIASCTGTTPNGAFLDTSTVGSKTFTATAMDGAGNQVRITRAYKVQFADSGRCLLNEGHAILPPIHPDGTTVLPKGLPALARFRVCDADGRSVNTPGVVSTFTLVGRVNSDGDQALNQVVPSLLSPPVFQWDGLTQAWTFVIDTRRLERQTRYRFLIRLADGTSIPFGFGVR